MRNHGQRECPRVESHLFENRLELPLDTSGERPMKYVVATLIVVAIFAAAYLLSARTVAAGQSCESLAALVLPDATITLARTVDAGAFAPPTLADGAAPAV